MNKTNQKSKQRRKLLTTTMGLGATAIAIPKQWQKPALNSVFTPAHAQMSQCGMPMIVNAVASPGSGATDCVISFNVVSDTTDIEIVSITNTAVTAPDNIVYGAFGTATSTSGPMVTWSGSAIGGITVACNDPISDVTFTVTYTCAAITSNLTMTFTLFDIAAVAT